MPTPKKMMAEIRTRAARLGLAIETHAPGDGFTRYLFINRAARQVGRARGRGEADQFLRGYEAGLEAGPSGRETTGQGPSGVL